MSYCPEALALRADSSRSKVVTKTCSEWLWCWIIPSSGVGEPWIEFFRAVRNCTAPGVWECCSGSFVQPCRTCCCSHVEIQQRNVAQVLQPCSELGRAMTNSPLSPQCFTFAFSSVNSLLVQARPWAGFRCFHSEPTCTSWSRFPCQQDQSYPAQSSFSHGIWGVMAILALLVTGLRLHISATWPKDYSGFGSIPGLPEAFLTVTAILNVFLFCLSS